MQLLCIFMFLLASTVSVLADGESKFKGAYDIWEDFEGGKVCKINLGDEPTIGGYALEGDANCFAAFKLDGDPYAWFVDQERRIVIIDATRKILIRFEPVEDGAFYARRTDAGLENINLTPADEPVSSQ